VTFETLHLVGRDRALVSLLYPLDLHLVGNPKPSLLQH
jgi:hypothetical protein